MSTERNPVKTRTLALVAVLALALVGCTATPTPEPSSPPATPDVPVAASVVVSADKVTVLDEDGTEISSYDYFAEDAQRAITELTYIFGFRAELTEQEAQSHAPRTTIHVWNGFELSEYHDVTPSSPEVNSFAVAVTTADVNGVEISAEGGVAVGTEELAAAPVAYRHVPNNGEVDPVDLYYLDETPVEIAGSPDYEPAALSVEAWVTGKDRLVTRMYAPMRNWGP